MAEPLVRIEHVTKRFGSAVALDDVSATIAAGRITGLVGPDGAGKTTLMRLMDGLLLPQQGSVTVDGRDAGRDAASLHHDIGYMPQRFGLYEDLTVAENLTLYADLRAVLGAERRETFARLLEFTALGPFQHRLAGKLSGGMKQKLGLACALIRRPKLLLLDEPSVGVDPISRRELWRMVHDLVDGGIGIVWSTSYLDEAERCGAVLLLNEGKLLFAGAPGELTGRLQGRSFLLKDVGPARRQVLSRLLARPGIVDGVVQGSSLRVVLAEHAAPPRPDDVGAAADARLEPTPPRFEDAFVALLGGARKEKSRLVDAAAPRHGDDRPVIEAKGLTKRFGDFTATDDVSFAVKPGEIFGLLGPNGAGKSTTFKMMCGLLRPSAGTATVAGLDLYGAGAAARAQIGYMAQKFSLYADLSVRQNLNFFAGAYGLSGARRRGAIERMIAAFGLAPYLDGNSGDLPLGFKQRLALACAVMHDPAVLFLDEPTSGVDPLTRREFWSHINAMVERGVSIMVTTHFLDEAEYCDRIALIYRGRVIASGSPDALKESAHTADNADPTLEDAFVALVEASDRKAAA